MKRAAKEAANERKTRQDQVTRLSGPPTEADVDALASSLMETAGLTDEEVNRDPRPGEPDYVLIVKKTSAVGKSTDPAPPVRKYVREMTKKPLPGNFELFTPEEYKAEFPSVRQNEFSKQMRLIREAFTDKPVDSIIVLKPGQSKLATMREGLKRAAAQMSVPVRVQQVKSQEKYDHLKITLEQPIDPKHPHPHV